MGGCVSKKNLTSSETIIRTNVEPRSRNSALQSNHHQSQNNNDSHPENRFKDYEEYEEEFSGEGIKKIKAYKCNLMINQLIQQRQEFWSTKKENRRSWQVIQRACETDCATAELILSNSGFVCLDGNMKCIVDTATGVVFNVPNFCINDPYFKKEFLKPEEVPEKILSITLIHVFKNITKYEIKISNSKNGGDLKDRFCANEQINKEEYKIRLLYKGQEIKETDLLSIYNFDNHPQVQVACNKIEPDY